MHSPSRTVNEASIIVPGSLTEDCSGSRFPQKSPENHILRANRCSSTETLQQCHTNILFQPSELLSSQKQNLSKSSPCLAPLGLDAKLLTLPLECAQLSVVPTAAVGYSGGSDGQKRSGIDLLASQYSHSVPFITNSLKLINF